VYYPPGSLKAKLCREGALRLLEFCSGHDIAVRRSGKVIVATRESELEPLNTIHQRGTANGLSGLELVGPGGLKDVEPNVSALAALIVPEAGVVDFGAVADNLAKEIVDKGHEVRRGFRVSAIEQRPESVRLVADSGDEIEAALLVNCAGLQSDRVARMAGAKPPVQIVPFRGEYYIMDPSRDHLVRNLVYPVPDPRFPFLGVHFTRRIDDSVEVGPNAVLAFGRHHYRGDGRPSWRDTTEMIRFPGLWRLGRKYWKTGTAEVVRSRSKRLYAAAARELIPDVKRTDLIRGGSGIRAQAVARDGTLADDFVIIDGPNSMHVLNAPSPAATACLAIGDRVASRLLSQHRTG
jgi:L-2-hydroxyglutarate oxidase LhgO